MTAQSPTTHPESPLVDVTPRKSFLQEVIDATPGDSRLEMCIQCGTCGGSCPSGPDMDHTPRALFALIRADMRDDVLTSNTPWYCVSCYFCTVRCPQDILITDIMYTLKSMAIDANLYKETAGSDLAQNFVGHIESYGRSFEFGLATRHFLRHQPRQLISRAAMGMGMFTKDRLDFTPHRIEGIDQLNAILDRAKELEARA